jgi:hypothetical protein
VRPVARLRVWDGVVLRVVVLLVAGAVVAVVPVAGVVLRVVSLCVQPPSTRAPASKATERRIGIGMGFSLGERSGPLRATDGVGALSRR